MFQVSWRREQDSNLRCPKGHIRFRGGRFSPLSHLSEYNRMQFWKSCYFNAKNQEQDSAPSPFTTARVGHSLGLLRSLAIPYFALLKSIRTRISACGARKGTSAFEADALVHSAISPSTTVCSFGNPAILMLKIKSRIRRPLLSLRLGSATRWDCCARLQSLTSLY